jgi:trans-aconitate 2-methyltransferase
MPTWNSDQYLKFAGERTRPAVDLATRVALDQPRRVIDLGCGPGNSTAVLARRWPQAELTGLDSSAAMLAAARKDFPQWQWVNGDIGTWTAAVPYDVVFSNAAYQWVPNHAAAIPRAFTQVAPGGVFAMQIPANLSAPPHRLIRELASSGKWRGKFAVPAREWRPETPAFYYDTLAPLAARLDIWEAEYWHILPNVAAIVEWYRGTGLRPWLDALPGDADREQFLTDYAKALEPEFPAQRDGKVLFPFRRLFVIAYRG